MFDSIKRKWERQYDRYIREADELEDEIEKLDLLHSRDKFAEFRWSRMGYYCC